MNALNLLLVDDDVDALQALKMSLEGKELHIHAVSSYKESMHHLEAKHPDIVVTDLKLKDGSGLEILQYVKEHFPQIEVIIITAFGSVESAVEAIRAGAADYLVKPFRIADLKRLIKRIGENVILRRENERLRKVLQMEKSFPQPVGVSRKFKNILEFAEQVATSRSTVLITGETGTGKEVIAFLIHHRSQRNEKPFIKINCCAIPENLLEAELFGYEKGAFTGAVKQKKGKIEMAEEGTLFLDEIGDMNLMTQAKLLHFLQDGEFERLGGTETLKLDVRIISATNADLERRVADGTFREDLFYRLNVISIRVPPLRERSEDIPFLIQHFIEKYNEVNQKNVQGIDPDVIKMCLRHPWRGNVRELENMVERAVVLCNENILKPYHFPGLVSFGTEMEKKIGVEIGMTLMDIEKLVIQKTLQFHEDDKQKAARTLDIGLATLYRKIKEYQLED
ncbi:sigma-54-dependent Fis family transcriptional regulator [bacterium]|nr:sigma-54-dependent Fis family transcriptional regulator [bacterium]